MKILKYNLCNRINIGTEENPEWEEVYTPVSMVWSELNEDIAKREAHNGEYTIEDNGVEEVYEPTAEERLSALEAAMLEMIGVTLNG